MSCGATMTERPFVDREIGELEQIARENEHEPGIIEALIGELRHRKLPRAKKLRERLEAQHSKQPSAPEDESSLPTTALPNNNPSQRFESPDPRRLGGADDFELLQQKYETLRATFTLEAELLAKWGMTPAMPLDLQNLVFDEWCKRLSHAGESVIQLAALVADRERLAEERGYASTARIPHAASTRKAMRPAAG